MSKNENQPAFPCTSDAFALGDKGLSKLEHFASLAMQGYCANAALFAAPTQDRVKWSLRDAHALIAALEAKTGALDESPIDMLHAIVSHADEPAMDDAQFRKFARSNAQFVIDSQKGGENG
jgi:hypothetical protein